MKHKHVAIKVITIIAAAHLCCAQTQQQTQTPADGRLKGPLAQIRKHVTPPEVQGQRQP